MPLSYPRSRVSAKLHLTLYRDLTLTHPCPITLFPCLLRSPHSAAVVMSEVRPVSCPSACSSRRGCSARSCGAVDAPTPRALSRCLRATLPRHISFCSQAWRDLDCLDSALNGSRATSIFKSALYITSLVPEPDDSGVYQSAATSGYPPSRE